MKPLTSETHTLASIAAILNSAGETPAVRESYRDEWGQEHWRTVTPGYVVQSAGEDAWRGRVAYVEHYGGTITDRITRAGWYATYLAEHGWRVSMLGRHNTVVVVHGRGSLRPWESDPLS